MVDTERPDVATHDSLEEILDIVWRLDHVARETDEFHGSPEWWALLMATTTS